MVMEEVGVILTGWEFLNGERGKLLRGHHRCHLRVWHTWLRSGLWGHLVEGMKTPRADILSVISTFLSSVVLYFKKFEAVLAVGSSPLSRELETQVPFISQILLLIFLLICLKSVEVEWACRRDNLYMEPGCVCCIDLKSWDYISWQKRLGSRILPCT